MALNTHMDTNEHPLPNLTVTDLGQLKQIVEVACSRGAFQANEMRQVGESYDRLAAFLNALLAQAEQEQPQETTQGESND